MSPSERRELDRMLDQIGEENAARYAAEPPPSAKAVAETAAFLKRWARSKPVTKATPGNYDSFWRCGSRMCKLSPKMVDALVAAGNVSRTGDVLRVVK
jgi:hypothetical protein